MAADVLSLMLHPVVEAFGKEILGEDQSQNQPDQKSPHELAHSRPRYNAPLFGYFGSKSPFLVADSEPAIGAKSRASGWQAARQTCLWQRLSLIKCSVFKGAAGLAQR